MKAKNFSKVRCENNSLSNKLCVDLVDWKVISTPLYSDRPKTNKQTKIKYKAKNENQRRTLSDCSY
jgi:hypothetical protein